MITRRNELSTPATETDAGGMTTYGRGEIIRAVKWLGVEPPALAGFKTFLDFHVAQWRAIDGMPGHDDLVAAFGFFTYFPLLFEQIGDDWRGESQRASAYYALRAAHHAGARLLIRAAEESGIDVGPIWLSATICAELFEQRGIAVVDHRRVFDTWPACLGRQLQELPDCDRNAVRAGDAALMRLNARLSLREPNHHLTASRETSAELQSVEERALAALFADPGAKVADIAERIGTNAKYLSDPRHKRFHSARKAARAGAVIPRGHKIDGRVEAFCDDVDYDEIDP